MRSLLSATREFPPELCTGGTITENHIGAA
uniref:Uncharacterized protein n=1 Tax=Mycolicibacterium phage phi1_186018 TaxID=3236641 RepID=A0AB39AKH5_9CAUD